MRRLILLFSILLFLSLAGQGFVHAQAAPGIAAPVQGQALQGLVIVTGQTQADGFQSWELSFGYDTPGAAQWFPLVSGSQPIPSGELGAWDTTLLSDGLYALRLVVTLADGTRLESVVRGLRVRNYTPIETDTPIPTQAETLLSGPTEGAPPPSPQVSVTPEATIPVNTATALPPNPAQVTRTAFTASLVLGGIVAISLFVLLGVYLLVRSAITRS